MYEIETKILEVDPKKIILILDKIGAKKIKESRLLVDWYGPANLTIDQQQWYLRVRKDSLGKQEVTWKSLPKIVGNTRQSKEINVNVSDFEKTKELFESLGFVNYAHQEKDRISWTYKDWSLDLDTYPNMPPYLEIEGLSEQHVNEMIDLLELRQHTAVSDGERVLIEKLYNLDWTNIRF